MKEQYPREYAARSADKLHYRYPGSGGESYMDLIMRLDSTITMLEQVRGNALLVCDRAVCRVLLAYFDAKTSSFDLDLVPNMEVQPGVIELRRSHSGFTTTYTKISHGATSRAAGPGTNLEGQTTNLGPAAELVNHVSRLAHAMTAPDVLIGASAPEAVARNNSSPS